jgi:hypothetical protein
MLLQMFGQNCMLHNPSDLWRLAHMFTLVLGTISVMHWRIDFYICYLLRNIWMMHGRIHARLPSRTKRRTRLPSTSYIQRPSCSSSDNYGLSHIACVLSLTLFITCLRDLFRGSLLPLLATITVINVNITICYSHIKGIGASLNTWKLPNQSTNSKEAFWHTWLKCDKLVHKKVSLLWSSLSLTQHGFM